MLRAKSDISYVFTATLVIPAKSVPAGLGRLGIKPDGGEEASRRLDPHSSRATPLVRDHLYRETRLPDGTLKRNVVDPVVTGTVVREVYMGPVSYTHLTLPTS